MKNEDSRKDLIKARLAEIIELPSQSLPPKGTTSPHDRRRSSLGLGQGFLFLSVFILVAGLYAFDLGGRAVFMTAALLYAAAGAWHLDHPSPASGAYRRS